MKKWNWALLGPGRFAREFAEELGKVDEANLYAVASSKLTRAESFASKFGFSHAIEGYDNIFLDPKVDIVYIVVPHPFHRELAEQALKSGKAVLCEKPLTPSLKDSKAVIELAKSENVFLMEAMKTGFLPAIQKAKQWIEEGRIGELKLAKADFCFSGPTDPADRLMNPNLAGGAVLDVGIYPIYLVNLLVGSICEIKASGSITKTGVEDSVSMISRHESESTSALTCSFMTEEAMDATIMGTKGEIYIPKFHAATNVELRSNGQIIDRFEDRDSGMLQPEIRAVHEALANGLTECPQHTHADTLKLAELMDSVRDQLGVKSV